jgi:heterodisulfide reductase subunit A
MNKPTIAIIGGGPAGLGAAAAIDTDIANVLLFDRNAQLGGHLTDWHQLNPTFTPANKTIDYMSAGTQNDNIIVFQNTTVEQLYNENDQITLKTSDNNTYQVDSAIFAGGYNTFDAHQKEELGYGIYKRVITSADLEKVMNNAQQLGFELQQAPNIGIVHCVGSRDVKCGNRYCSRICCMVGVKQAIELKQKYPNANVSCFYMDLRMNGRGYEELYLRAQQEFGIKFIRGRVSEVSENHNKLLQLKAEDTLLGRPIRGTFDLLVLLVGMEPPIDNPLWATISKGNDGFALETLGLNAPINNKIPGLFWAGTCKGPSTSADAYRDGQHTAIESLRYIKSKSK